MAQIASAAFVVQMIQMHRLALRGFLHCAEMIELCHSASQPLIHASGVATSDFQLTCETPAGCLGSDSAIGSVPFVSVFSLHLAQLEAFTGAVA